MGVGVWLKVAALIAGSTQLEPRTLVDFPAILSLVLLLSVNNGWWVRAVRFQARCQVGQGYRGYKACSPLFHVDVLIRLLGGLDLVVFFTWNKVNRCMLLPKEVYGARTER